MRKKSVRHLKMEQFEWGGAVTDSEQDSVAKVFTSLTDGKKRKLEKNLCFFEKLQTKMRQMSRVRPASFIHTTKIIR